MILGRSILNWVLLVFFTCCVFILARFFIPLLFGLIDVTLPEQIVTVLALLLALGVFYSGYGWRSGPVV